jgi:hypothetical protein
MKKLYPLLCFFLLLLAAPQAKAQTCSFNLAQDTGCITSPILATATDTAASAQIIQRQWVLTTCSGVPVFASAPGFFPNFSYVPTTPGCYCLTLTSTNQLGQTCTIQQCDILIADTVHFDSLSVSPSPICAPQLVTLQMQNTAGCGTITNTAVQWGCGNITNAAGNPTSLTHVYDGTCNPICYNINVVVTNSCGCVSHVRVLNAVCVLPKPVANFTNATSCNTGDTVFFQNTSTGANRYHWQFGCVADTFSNASPRLLLPHCDTCNVTLIAYNDTTACSQQKTQLIQTMCSSVTASFSGDTVGCSSQPMVFRNTTSGHLQGITYWSFGGGGFNSPGDTAVRTFAAGVYQVGMRFVNFGGCVDTVYKTIQVYNLQADFTPSSVCLPDSFRFQETAFSSMPGYSSIVTWSWNFGNGDTSVLQNPVHYFPLGIHTVSLTVTNTMGCTASVTKTVSANTPVYVNWTVDTNICPSATAPICITNNTSSGVSLTETWQFPGANISSYTGHYPPCLTYSMAGDFPIVYQVTGGTCNRIDTVMVHNYQPQLCGYLSDDYASCPPLVVCATNCSQNIDSLTDIYTWDFGIATYLETNPCDFYSYPGCHVVTLSVLTNNGCTDTLIVDTVCIGGPYVSSFTVEPTFVCACEDSVHFDIGTVGASEFAFVHVAIKGLLSEILIQ